MSIRAATASLGFCLLVLVPLACSDPAPAKTKTYVSFVIKAGPDPQQPCPLIGESLTIGTFSESVADGDTFEDARIAVSCQVSGSGSGPYTTKLQTVRAGAALGGTLTIAGKLNQSGQQNAIEAVFVRDGQLFRQSDCVIEYPSYGGVYPGRVWGTLRCDRMTVENQPGRLCSATAEHFRFENCTE